MALLTAHTYPYVDENTVCHDVQLVSPEEIVSIHSYWPSALLLDGASYLVTVQSSPTLPAFSAFVPVADLAPLMDLYPCHKCEWLAAWGHKHPNVRDTFGFYPEAVERHIRRDHGGYYPKGGK